MSKLLYTDNIPFDMSDWDGGQIKSVFAGKNCIMAITETGETLQKIKNPEYMSRTQYWTRIKQIGISKWAEGVAIGLVEDGTCLIAKRPIRKMCEDRRLNFEHINDTVKSWNDVIQVAASDAFFALRSDGTVRYVSFCEHYQAEYEEIKEWREVIRIVTGVQNSVFGITRQGTVLSAGSNANNLKDKLLLLNDVLDLYPTGSECTDMYVLKTDGKVSNIRNTQNVFCADKRIESLDGHFFYKVYAITDGRQIIDVSAPDTRPLFPKQYKTESFAVGDVDYSTHFVIAVVNEQ